MATVMGVTVPNGEQAVTDPSDEARRQAMALRGEFVHAFVEHVGPRPASERMAVRLPAVIIVAALTAAGAVVVGLFWHLLQPTEAAAGSKADAAPRITYAAVAGWDCVGSNDHGFDAEGRSAGWLTQPSGGWREDGCHGTYESIPMSGKATIDDPTQYARWWFMPSSGKCSTSVFIPGVPNDSPEAAAGAAHYTVSTGQGDAPYAEFVVDQTKNRGQWVTAGTFPVKDKGFVVTITNRGAPRKPGDRIAVSQVRIECSA
jgi:hypothetical protein